MAKSPKATQVTNQEETYAQLRSFVFSKIGAANKTQLLAAWDIGERLYDVVQDNNQYGSNIVNRLGEDMVEQGLSGTHQAATSEIYAAMRVFQSFSRKKIGDLADVGATPRHARVLSSVDSELMHQVLAEAVDYDSDAPRICSTRALAEIVKRLAVAKGENLPDPVAQTIDHAVALDEGVGQPAPAPLTGDGDGKQALPEPPSNLQLADVDSPPEQAGSATTESSGSVSHDPEIKHPLKLLKDFEKLATRLSVSIPDVLIALEQVDKTGFDGERAQKNFCNAFADLKASAKELQEPLGALVEKAKSYDFDPVK